MRMRWLIALVVGVTALPAAGHAQSSFIRRVMQEKLLSAQRLLEAVITADHAAISRHVAPLSRISEAEIASWQAAARPEYVKEASAFLLAVDGLGAAAEARDIEAATAEYTNLIASCTRCHTIVRQSRRASFQPTVPTAPSSLQASRGGSGRTPSAALP